MKEKHIVAGGLSKTKYFWLHQRTPFVRHLGTGFFRENYASFNQHSTYPSRKSLTWNHGSSTCWGSMFYKPRTKFFEGRTIERHHLTQLDLFSENRHFTDPFDGFWRTFQFLLANLEYFKLHKESTRNKRKTPRPSLRLQLKCVNEAVN